MGGGGGSSSSSSTTTQTDERIAASDNAIVVQLDSGATFEITDPMSWDALGVALATYGDVLETAVNFAEKESDKATGLVTKILDQNVSEDQQNYTALLKWGGLIALAVTAAGVMKKG